jgi:hypothetical protein
MPPSASYDVVNARHVTSPPGWPKRRPCLSCDKMRPARNAGDRICGICRRAHADFGDVVVAGVHGHELG